MFCETTLNNPKIRYCAVLNDRDSHVRYTVHTVSHMLYHVWCGGASQVQVHLGLQKSTDDGYNNKNTPIQGAAAKVEIDMATV